MACTLTTGRGVDCRNAIGGLKSIYLFVDDSDNAQVLTTGDFTATAQEITTFAALQPAVQIDLRKGSASFTQNIMASVENGTLYYEQVVEAQLHKMDVETLALVDSLSKVRVTIAVHDQNDNVYILGVGNGAEVTGGTGETGTGFGDFHGFNLTITAESTLPAFMAARTSGPGSTGYPFDGLTTGVTISATNITPTFD